MVKTIGNSIHEIVNVVPNSYMEMPHGVLVYYKGIEPFHWVGVAKMALPDRKEYILVCEFLDDKGNITRTYDQKELNKYHFQKLDTPASKVLYGG